MKKTDYTLKNKSGEKSCRLKAILAVFVFAALFSLARPAEVRADDYKNIIVPDNGQVKASDIEAELASSATRDVRLVFDTGDTITLDMDQNLDVNTILLRDCYVTECYEARKPQNKGKNSGKIPNVRIYQERWSYRMPSNKGKQKIEYLSDYVVFDLETTGTSWYSVNVCFAVEK